MLERFCTFVAYLTLYLRGAWTQVRDLYPKVRYFYPDGNALIKWSFGEDVISISHHHIRCIFIFLFCIPVVTCCFFKDSEEVEDTGTRRDSES